MSPTITSRTSRYSGHACAGTGPCMGTDHSKPRHSYLTYSVMSQISDNHFHNMTNEVMDNTFRASH